MNPRTLALTLALAATPIVAAATPAGAVTHDTPSCSLRIDDIDDNGMDLLYDPPDAVTRTVWVQGTPHTLEPGDLINVPDVDTIAYPTETNILSVADILARCPITPPVDDEEPPPVTSITCPAGTFVAFDVAGDLPAEFPVTVNGLVSVVSTSVRSWIRTTPEPVAAVVTVDPSDATPWCYEAPVLAPPVVVAEPPPTATTVPAPEVPVTPPTVEPPAGDIPTAPPMLPVTGASTGFLVLLGSALLAAGGALGTGLRSKTRRPQRPMGD